ncbi:unnamed protein product [Rodentolepis nana]|uniref:Uncharacterized protein n=1 Tax=Rodentolepis nana TaxID=102285 RepID=A0A0R3TXF2_RODNA|nr:unnamed protein product [Rodentolepis nana]
MKEEKLEPSNISDTIISEIESALSKAKIAYEKSAPYKQSNNSSRKTDEMIKNSVKPKEPSSVRSLQKMKLESLSPSALPKRSYTRTNPAVAVKFPRQGGAPSEAVVLRKKAKSWLSSKTSESFAESSNGSFNSQTFSKQSDRSSYTYNMNKPNPSMSLELNEISLQRIKDIIALSKSMEMYTEEALIGFNDSAAQIDFLNFCGNLVNHVPFNIEYSLHFFSHNLSELTLLFDQFTKIYEVVDWNVATPRQHHWRRVMLENFLALFNIAESFKPILIGKPEESNATSLNEILGDEFPSLETLWKAYVCTGRELPLSYADPPVEFPSRRCRLTIGSAIFPSSSKSRQDFEEMLDFWSEIFHLQRRLQILNFVEKQLPLWLGCSADKSRIKASTLRLLCQIACDCFPVTVVNN